MPRGILATVAGLLAAHASGQWSEPARVPYETDWCNYEFVITPGDTIWACCTRGQGGLDSAVAYAAWSAGDSWSRPESIDCTELAISSAAGVDAEGRVWYLRYDGVHPWRRDFGAYVVGSVRERTGWRNLHQVLRGCCPTMQCADLLEFAVDKVGTPWLGISEHVHESGGQYNSGRFGRIQGDTCTWPAYIVKGETLPNYRWVGRVDVEPHPVSGMWSVCEVDDEQGRRLCVHRLQGDSAVFLHEFGRILLAAAVDSTGRFWVFYADSSHELKSATISTDSVVEHKLLGGRLGQDLRGVSACVDGEGWVWCAWPSEDATMMVSWNRGGEWAEPEQAALQDCFYSRLLPDSRGIPHLYYGWFGEWHGVRRLARPGVEEGGDTPYAVRHTQATIVRGSLVLPGASASSSPSLLLDAAGRKAAELRPGVNDVSGLSPGVYFVCGEGPRGQGSKGPSRKVVLAR